MNSVTEKDFMEALGSIRKLNAPSRLMKISHAEFMVLHLLSCREKEEPEALGIKVGEVGQCLFNSNAAASKMLSSMEEKDYIRKVHDPEDKRVTRIELTDNGRRVFEESGRIMKRFFEDVMDKMGDEDSKKMLELIKKLHTIIELELEQKGRKTE